MNVASCKFNQHFLSWPYAKVIGLVQSAVAFDAFLFDFVMEWTSKGNMPLEFKCNTSRSNYLFFRSILTIIKKWVKMMFKEIHRPCERLTFLLNI